MSRRQPKQHHRCGDDDRDPGHAHELYCASRRSEIRAVQGSDHLTRRRGSCRVSDVEFDLRPRDEVQMLRRIANPRWSQRPRPTQGQNMPPRHDPFGKPSRRSAMVLSRISSVPPPILMPGTPRTNGAHEYAPAEPESATSDGPRSSLTNRLMCS